MRLPGALWFLLEEDNEIEKASLSHTVLSLSSSGPSHSHLQDGNGQTITADQADLTGRYPIADSCYKISFLHFVVCVNVGQFK